MGGYTYYTKQGDMWDYIAWLVYGNEDYAYLLYRANAEYLTTWIFDDNVPIWCPVLDTSEQDDEEIPDWRDTEDMDEELTDDGGDDE